MAHEKCRLKDAALFSFLRYLRFVLFFAASRLTEGLEEAKVLSRVQSKEKSTVLLFIFERFAINCTGQDRVAYN